jgi:hypothetical protein
MSVALMWEAAMHLLDQLCATFAVVSIAAALAALKAIMKNPNQNFSSAIRAMNAKTSLSIAANL